MFKRYTLILLSIILLSCQSKYKIPNDAEATDQNAPIYPDYKEIVIPSNIAPLNFRVNAKADQFVVSLTNEKGEQMLSGANNSGIVIFPIDSWKQYISQNKGQNITVTIYAKQGNNWISYKTFPIQIAEEEIDNYLSYRLIEPGYEIYRQLGLYQRNLTDFSVRNIYENPRKICKESHCVNCHNFQNYSAQRMLFHIRGTYGGTLVANNGKIEKINPKNDSILGNAVYPAWHPTQPLVLFSSNKTGQVFHMKDLQRVEVIDYASDLILYDVNKREISNVLKTENALETFPTWSPTGDKVFFCQASLPTRTTLSNDSAKISETVQHFDQLQYNLMSITYDSVQQTFGEPKLEVNCVEKNRSASQPRVSPDGRYVLFSMGNYGQFHVWHNTADLYILDLQTQEIRSLSAANSRHSEAFHSWSSDGRWIAFASRRDDGSFTRIYICYFDRQGIAHKAFMLPQEDPTQNLSLFKSYNVPELTRDAVPYSEEQLRKVIYNTQAQPVQYKSAN